MKTTAIILFFVLLGVIYSYPLILNLNSALPYTHAPESGFENVQLIQGDHLLLYYIYWLVKDYFLTQGQELFREPYMFSIPQWPSPYEPRGLPSSILFLLFSIFGNALAYNSMAILSFILCGLFTYLLSKKYIKDEAGAIVSGVIFAISPFRLAQLFGGHPTGFILFWIPLIIYLYELLWEKKKIIYGWLAGLFIFLMCMEEHHMGYYTALFTIAFWMYKYYLCNEKRALNFLQFIWLVIPVAIGWFFSALYMMYVKSIVFNVSIAHVGRTLDEIKLYAPTIRHIFQRINPDGEKYIYIGIVPGILLLIGLFKYQKNKFPYLFYFLVFSISLLLSLGPNLKYLPIYRICYKIIPFFHFPRSPARLYMYALLSLSLLAGYGIKIIRPRYIYTTFIILLLCLDFHPYPRIGLSRLSKGNKTYEFIKNSFPKNPLLEIPLWPGESSWTSIYQYYTTIYRIPIINGYSPFVTRRYLEEIFWPLVSINMGMINEEQYELLKKLNIKYINLHEEAYPQKVNPFPFKIALENLKKSPYLKFTLVDGPIYLFQVLDEPLGNPPSYTIPSKTGVFYECEYMPHRIGTIKEDPNASGGLSLFADQSVTEPAHLIFGPWQLFPPGRYKILFRVKGQATLEVTTDKGKTQIAHRNLDITDKYEDYVLHFTINKLTELEFRIVYYGKGPVWADYVYLLCEEEDDPVWHYEAEDLFHIGREIDDAIYATPELDPPGDLIFGPYRRYPEGRYRVGFRLKAGEKTDQESAILKILDIRQPLRDISTEYKTYWLEITLDKPTVLEFKVEFLKEVPIYVDSIFLATQKMELPTGRLKNLNNNPSSS